MNETKPQHLGNFEVVPDQTIQLEKPPIVSSDAIESVGAMTVAVYANHNLEI